MFRPPAFLRFVLCGHDFLLNDKLGWQAINIIEVRPLTSQNLQVTRKSALANVGIRKHFASVVHRGYESDKEALEIKFPPNLHGSGLEIPMFSTGFIDGHTKATMVLAVFALLEHIRLEHTYGSSPGQRLKSPANQGIAESE